MILSFLAVHTWHKLTGAPSTLAYFLGFLEWLSIFSLCYHKFLCLPIWWMLPFLKLFGFTIVLLLDGFF